MDWSLLTLPDRLERLYPYVWDRIINIIFQTLLYGLSLFLAPITVHVMLTNGVQNRARKWLLAITISMFALSTVYWILSVVFTFWFIFSGVPACLCLNSDSPCFLNEEANSMRDGLVMLSSILLVNYIIADGIVVWRAWVLCSDQSGILLRIPLLLFAINTIIYLMTVAMTATELTMRFRGYNVYSIDTIINISQVVFVTFSLFINFSATSIIARKAWDYRKLLMEDGIGIRTPRQAISILGVLVESGAIYILISVTILATLATLLAFRVEMLGDMFMPVAIQFVGIYPFVVVLPMEKNRVAPGPVLSSGGQIDLAMKPPSIDIHVTSDPALEPGDEGMSARNSKV